MRQYILAAFLLFVCIAGHCQKTLLVDETWYTTSGATGFRIITSNDSIAHYIMSRYEDKMQKFTYTKKSDRKGYYWERSFYFKNNFQPLVVGDIRKRFR